MTRGVAQSSGAMSTASLGTAVESKPQGAPVVAVHACVIWRTPRSGSSHSFSGQHVTCHVLADRRKQPGSGKEVRPA